MKYFIITFGCQMNYSDSERISAILEQLGYKKSQNQQEADLILLNSCSVRQQAMDRIFGLVAKFEKMKKLNPRLKTILTGCVLPKDKKKLLGKYDLIFNIKDIASLIKFLNKTLKIKNSYLNILPKYESKFSANVPIMTGCNNFCSYCAVPYTRGQEISRKARDIICEIKNLSERKYKEIWLLGQNVNSYKDGKINFPRLLEMTNKIPGDFWIRFTSPHPKDFSDKLIKVMVKSKKITPYLNFPIQSGDDSVLKRMNRPYTVLHYKKIIDKVRLAFEKKREGLDKNLTISTDIIVGFPGETKKQFENTTKVFKEIGYDMAYISKFSPRPGTIAAKMPDNVSKQEKVKRWSVLNEILKKTAKNNNEKYFGKDTRALIDSQKDGFIFGKTRHYKSIKIRLPNKLKNKKFIGKFANIKIIKIMPWGLEGQLI